MSGCRIRSFFVAVVVIGASSACASGGVDGRAGETERAATPTVSEVGTDPRPLRRSDEFVFEGHLIRADDGWRLCGSVLDREIDRCPSDFYRLTEGDSALEGELVVVHGRATGPRTLDPARISRAGSG